MGEVSQGILMVGSKSMIGVSKASDGSFLIMLNNSMESFMGEDEI